MPNLTTSSFPIFSTLPSSSSSTPSPSSQEPNHYLLAQIKENMTITQPTLIVTDRTGQDFALVFDDCPGPQSRDFCKQMGFRKGSVVVVPDAVRTERDDGGGEKRIEAEIYGQDEEIREKNKKKKAVVRVPAGKGKGVRVIPGGLEQVFEMALILDGISCHGADGDGEENSAAVGRCGACGKEGGGGTELMKCTGCGVSAYCGKPCQVRGWSELGHRSNCKVIKSIRTIWP